MDSLPVSINGTNAIKEASITLFLSSPIIKPERFKSLAEGEQAFFQSYKGIDQVSSSITLTKGKLSIPTAEQINAGFKLDHFEDGKPSFVAQGLNTINQYFFSFHNLRYTRWKDFLETTESIIQSLLKIQKEIFVIGVSLNYIDEFNWKADKDIDLSEIFEQNDYLPGNFIKVTQGQLINTREQEIDGKKLLDRIEVLVNSIIIKGIKLSHNQTLLLSEMIEISDTQNRDQISKTLNQLHESNKKLLHNILNKETKKLIGLT